MKMADQPPLTQGAASSPQTWWDSPYKPYVLNILYLWSAAIFIFICLYSHSKGEQSPHKFHWGFFHTEFYDVSKLKLNDQPWVLHGSEVWEFYAIFLTMIFSLLLLFEPQEKPGIIRIVFCAILVLFACIAGLFFLGLHFTGVYQILLLFMVLVLTLVDGLMFRASGELEYKLLQFYVDIPMLISLGLLIFYVDLPLRSGTQEFFGGALAFQFIIGCVLVVLVRAHKRILGEVRLVPISMILIFFDPYYQVFAIMKERRKGKKAAKLPPASPSGESRS
jgi:hypothetical protein